MELGNIMFGNSRGEFEVERSPWVEGPWGEFMDAAGLDSDGCESTDGSISENDEYRIMSYDWDAECDCGAEGAMDDWHDRHHHRPWCYQSIVAARLYHKHGWRPRGSGDAWDAEYLRPPKGLAFTAETAIQDEVRKSFCDKLGLPHPFGCAVHCTCDYEVGAERRWGEIGGHTDSCRLVQPNFLHKPSGLAINWYKYPFRDSYSNVQLTKDMWRDVMKKCIASIA